MAKKEKSTDQLKEENVAGTPAVHFDEAAHLQTAHVPAVAAQEKTLGERMKDLGASASLVKRAVKAAENFELMETPRIPKLQLTGDGIVTPDMDADEQPLKEFTGVIFYAEKNKAFYAKAYEKGSTLPPDCYSFDGKTPEADSPALQSPVCKTCPQNQYNSAVRDGVATKGKACRDLRNMYFLKSIDAGEESIMPLRATLTPTSLKNFETYLTNLVSNGLSLSEVVTKITSKKKERTDPFAIISFTKVRSLDEDKEEDAQALKNIAALKSLWLPIMKRSSASDLIEEAAEAIVAEAAPDKREVNF